MSIALIVVGRNPLGCPALKAGSRRAREARASSCRLHQDEENDQTHQRISGGGETWRPHDRRRTGSSSRLFSASPEWSGRGSSAFQEDQDQCSDQDDGGYSSHHVGVRWRLSAGAFQLSAPFDWPRGLSPPRSLAATRKDCPKACSLRCEWPRGMTKPGGFVISACFGVWPMLLSSGVAGC